jgi:hypothetical protein
MKQLYDYRVKEYERMYRQAKNPNTILAFKLKRIQETCTNITHNLSSSSSSIGASEIDFLQFLRSNCPINIRKAFSRGKSYTFNFSKRENNYSPDIVYTDESFSFKIDIEIDEPYIGITGVPIHFIDNTGISQDDGRGEIFSTQHWTTIRFSEEQVVRFPHLCANYILEVIKNIHTLNLSSPVTSLPIHRRWTYSEAAGMAYNKTREAYLGKAFDNKKDNLSNNNLEEDLPF